MVTRKEEKKNTSSSLRASPSAGCPAGQAAASPSPTLSQLRPAACTGEPGTDLSAQASPTPGDQGQGQGLPRTPPEPRDLMAKFQAGLGPARLSQALALPHLPGPPWSAPCPALSRTRPGRGIRGRCAPGPYSPLADMVQAAGAEAPSAEEKPAGRGDENIPETHTRANAPAVGRRLAARRTPGCLGTSGQGDLPPGCGNADS